MHGLQFPLPTSHVNFGRKYLLGVASVMDAKASCIAAAFGIVVFAIIFISAMVGTSLRKLDTDEGNGDT